MAALVRAAHDEPGRTAFAVLSDGGEAIGSSSLDDHVPAMARVEIGFTYDARLVWGSRVNPACRLALLTQAFDEWGCARVALRADATNSRSIGAMTRLGGVPEGVLLAGEWPAVRAGLLARLGA